MNKLNFNITKSNYLLVSTIYDNKVYNYEIETTREVLDFIDNLEINTKNLNELANLKKQIKELKSMFQVQCICCFGGPGLGKSTTALNVTADLKKLNIDADYTSEVAKEKVYGKNLSDLEDQSGIIGEQIKRLNLLAKYNHIDIAVQDSPFLLSVAYQSKDDPHVDEADFVDYYVNQYLNYINLNILLDRNNNTDFQKSGRIHDLNDSLSLDEKIKQEVLTKNNLPFISLPAFDANIFMVELGKTMHSLTLRDKYEIFYSSEDKRQKSLNYHILILERTIYRLKHQISQIEIISDNIGIEIDVVLSVLKENKKINQKRYLSNEDLIEKLTENLVNLINLKV